MLSEEKRETLLENISSLPDDKLRELEEHLAELLKSGSDAEQRYLTFQCGEQTFGIHISRVRQIIQLPPITPLPGFAPYIKGVVSLREEMIPTIDLRLRLGKPEAQTSSMMTLLIVALDDGVSFGLIIDAVNNVEEIFDEDIQPLPVQQGDHSTAYLRGVTKKETAVLIMDVAALLVPDELDSLCAVSEKAEF